MTIKERLKEFKGEIRYDWLLTLVVVSFLGFIVEDGWKFFADGYVDNRNMTLPFLIGYGLAIFAIYIMFGVPRKTGFIGTLVYFIKLCLFVNVGEILLGYAVELLCGFYYWDYTKLPLHITRYTSVFTSIGFAAIIFIFMESYLERILNFFREKAEKYRLLRLVSPAIVFILVLDYFYSFAKMFINHDKNIIWTFYRTDWEQILQRFRLPLVLLALGVVSYIVLAHRKARSEQESKEREPRKR